MRLRHTGSPAALLVSVLPLAAFVAYAGSGLAQRRPAAAAAPITDRDRFDLDLDREEVRSAHVALLHSRLNEWEQRAATGDGEVRLTARELRYLRRVSAEIAKPGE